jgi:Mn-dependent DtxR family transcriptional regulator
MSEPDSLEERLLFYMEKRCEGQILQGVEKAASSIQCSKRQLLRILKRLTEEGIVVKTGKGRYQLTDSGNNKGIR